MEVFKDYAYYYNLFYKDKNYAEEVIKVKSLLDDYKQGTVSDLIVMGCGTGNHDREFVKFGYNIKGIDFSAEMIELAKEYAAKQELYKLDYEVADVRNYKSEKVYDAAVSLFHVMSYQNSNEDILSAFCSASELIKPGGLLIFDIWYGAGVLSEKPEVRVKQVETEEATVIRHAKPIMYPNKNVVEVNYEILVIDKKTNLTKKIEEVHSMRYFFAPELEYYLKQCGFEMLNIVDTNTLKLADFNSWTAYIVASKR